MPINNFTDRDSGQVLIANAPEGADAWFLARTLEEAADAASVIHVCRDDARMAQMAEALAFFRPETELVTLPAWDCLPYDRVSPQKEILAERLDALIRLSEAPARAGRVVLTTVNAIIQRLPPRTLFDGRVWRMRPGERVAPDKLTGFLAANGYQRVDTVNEPGEYAVRGGIVDLFATGSERPFRLDFFGDELEQIRTFDPLNQRSEGSAEEVVLKPVSEILLSEDSIARFRSAYREVFGSKAVDDPLYEAISAGRAHQGMEHWLPLFYERLETLFDYLPGIPVTFDANSAEVREIRLETIHDFHQARREIDEGGEQGERYRALAPEALYILEDEWQTRLAERARGVFQAGAAPDVSEVEIVDAGGRPGESFAEARIKGGHAVFEALADYQGRAAAAGRRVVVATYSQGARERIAHLLNEHTSLETRQIAGWSEVDAISKKEIGLAILGIERGFAVADVTVVSEQDVLGERISRPARRRRRGEDYLTEVSSLAEGDLVVHVEHGIGRYEGLETLDVGGAPHDCLKVVYRGGDRLFVPVETIEVLSRFGSESAGVDLDRLGSSQWQARRARVKERLREIAAELMKIAAEREVRQLEPVVPPSGLYDEFCARFPYPETDDQLRTIEQVLEDLKSGRPMDRLVCGDVGFGKTEVALRAAFAAALAGHQVAVVVPTTLLARQHFETFRARFSGLPVKIGQLSRLVGTKESERVRAGLADGTLDIVIGTHALLSKTIRFKNLGLLVVDEEQHFGVKQKERLKQMRAEVHVLTLTATPIPRTLQLSMSGLREMSLIATPPVDRLAVRTFVLQYDPVVVREAILREHYRGGQVFYVCPRLEDLPKLEERLSKLVPEVKVGVAHGQLAARELESVMTDFYERRYDVLLSTNIVESGLDIPTANTLIIHRADMFGLSQLYQLRGRIGRGKIRGYAYLTLPQGRLLTAGAQKRLEVMQTLDHLGAGFTLASHDLDIRGAGNLLGEEQSGQIREVGVELYQQMLEEAVATMRGADASRGSDAEWTPQINIGTAVLIPDSYVKDLDVRLGLYRRLSHLVEKSEIEAFAAELIDRFGPLPEEVENLLEVIAIKQLCRQARVKKIDAGPKGAVVSFHADSFPNPAGLVQFINDQLGKVQMRPDNKLVYRRGWESRRERLRGARRLLEQLAEVAEGAESVA